MVPEFRLITVVQPLIPHVITVYLALAAADYSCKDNNRINYTLPMFEACPEREHPGSGRLKTVPKLIPISSVVSGCHQGRKNEISPGLRICKIPDCVSNPCENGWCEETITAFVCHCPPLFTGRYCEERVTTQVVFDCPPDFNHTVELGSLCTVAYWVPPNTTNTQGAPTVRANLHPGHFFKVTNETVKVGYTVSDGSGWVDESCSFNINTHYVDTTPPVVRCVEDINTSVELGTPNTSVAFTQPAASDISGDVALVSHNHESGDRFVVGSTVVEYVFTDGSGNNASCIFNVTVNAIDTTPPMVTWCPANQTITVPVGEFTQAFTWSTPIGMDEAGIASIIPSHEPGMDVTVGNTITVVYTVTDNSGLTNISCSFNLTARSEDPSWKCSSSKCYQLLNGLSDWYESKLRCSAMNSVLTRAGLKTPSLLHLSSEGEFKQMRELIDLKLVYYWILIWINCNDEVDEGVFVCDVDGSGTGTPLQLINWGINQPNGGPDENCVMTNSFIFMLDDETCHFNRSTVCQLVLNPSYGTSQ
ncbi:uncharacterized protein LOC135155844 [Lytechinus pictus]|uniref:uncharacterized protein LOC135155844 n=1 Tax=Lytechinus pictus TaxID=7653 RepID=UPI0030BA175F